MARTVHVICIDAISNMWNIGAYGHRQCSAVNQHVPVASNTGLANLNMVAEVNTAVMHMASELLQSCCCRLSQGSVTKQTVMLTVTEPDLCCVSVAGL